MKKYLFDADPFARAFLENRSKSMQERVALGILEAAHWLPIEFPENCMLPTVGNMAVNGASGFAYNCCLRVSAGDYDRLIAENPEHAEALAEIRDQMLQYDTGKRTWDSIPESHKRLMETKAYWGGGILFFITGILTLIRHLP